MKKVLIVDDDLELQDLLKFTFEKAGGYEVYQAHDGKEGLKKIKEVLPDIVVLDVVMPEMNGFEVIEEIRNDPEICLVPVVMLTSLSEKRDKLTGIKLGADEYLVKPVDPYDLLACVENLVKKYSDNVDKLTKLPGIDILEEHLKEILFSKKFFNFLYIDISNFKPFNIKYKFETGDKVLKLFSSILRSVIKNYGTDKDSCYHIEADDFCIITFADRIDDMVWSIFSLFDSLIEKFYDKEAIQNGYFVYNLEGNVEVKSNLMKVCIAAEEVTADKYENFTELFSFVKELIKAAKEKSKQTNTHRVIRN